MLRHLMRGCDVGVTNHAEKQMMERLGSGVNAIEIARRAWTKHEPVPESWQVPRPAPRFENLKYGECAFIFSRHGGMIDGEFCGKAVLVTVAGPFSATKPWQKNFYGRVPDLF